MRPCCSAKNLPFPPAAAVGDFLMERYDRDFTECAILRNYARIGAESVPFASALHRFSHCKIFNVSVFCCLGVKCLQFCIFTCLAPYDNKGVGTILL